MIFHSRFDYCRHVDYILRKAKGIFFGYQYLLRSKKGLSTEVKFLIYRQIIRPVLAYVFPAWFGISSSQMNRIIMWERRVIKSCLVLNITKLDDGTYKYPSYRRLYDDCHFSRVDQFLVKGGLKFLETSEEINNTIIKEMLICNENIETITTWKHLPPAALRRLKEENMLFRNDKLLFYHWRYNTFNLEDTVYITTQLYNLLRIDFGKITAQKYMYIV